MSIEPGRVVQVRTPGSTEGTYRFGSGYFVAHDLVLTARHVLVRPEFTARERPVEGQPCEISFGNGWLAARLEAAGDVDVAVLRTAADGGWHPARWAKLVGSEPVHWDAVGYPVANVGQERREREHAYGEVSPLTGDGDNWLGLTVTSREPREAGTPATGWAGLSGAAVLCEGRIIGVITEDLKAYSRSLKALRAIAILADPVIAAALDRPSAPEVGGRPFRRPAVLEAGRPVLLIVDDEDAEVIGEQVRDLAQPLTAADVPAALDLIQDPALRIDAALVDICIGEYTGESGRSVLDALRTHRPQVPRSVISSDPYMGLYGDVTESLGGKYGVYKTLRKPGPGEMTPDLRACAAAMLQAAGEGVTVLVRAQIDALRDAYVRNRLIKWRTQARRRRRDGEIDEAELQEAVSRVERAEAAVAEAIADADTAEADAKWEAVDWLRGRLEKLTAGAG
jgi:Trypsin-like peptidase domain